MRVLRGTLTFVLGMIIGVILFVIAVGGAVMIVATSITMGDLQSKFTEDEIISSDSAVYDKSVWDTLKQVVDDVKELDTLSMQRLYDTYGISLLKGLGDIDFTTKDFYDMPIKEVLDDMSVVFDSFTLNDIGSIAGIEFPDLPIIQDNLDSGMKTAIENIMGSIDDNMTVRDISDKFGIDIGVEANKIIEALQDAPLSAFGDIVNAMRLDKLMETDTDTFVLNGINTVYVKLGDSVYEKVSDADLSNADFTPAIGVETYVCGAIDTDDDGTCDTLVEKELRYVKKTVTDSETGEEKTTYVVDKSCYDEEFSIENNEKEYYRHVLYAINGKYNVENPQYFVLSYANRVATTNGTTYTLVEKGVFSLDNLYSSATSSLGKTAITSSTSSVNLKNYAQLYMADKDGNVSENLATRYEITDDTITKDSRLEESKSGNGDYVRVYDGKSSEILQLVAHMTVAQLQEADDLLDSIKIGDVVDTDADDCAKILKTLKDSKLSDVGNKVNNLTLSQMIDIKHDKYRPNDNGKYVLACQKDENDNTIYVDFDNDNVNNQYFTRYSYDGTSYTVDSTGDYMPAYYFTLYNPALHEGLTRFELDTENVVTDASSKVLQRLAYFKLDDFSDSFDSLTLGEVMDIDIDILASTLDEEAGVTYYYYDTANSLYMRITDANKSEHTSDTKYYVIASGDDASVLKRIAYVKINAMSDAMDKVMKDMLLSELVDIYNDYAVEENTSFSLDKYNETTDRFFIEDTDGDGYVFAYNSEGKYTKGNWYMQAYTQEELDACKLSTSSYSYVAVYSSNETTAFAEYNVYYKGNKTVDGNTVTVYENNIPLCIYQLTSGATLENPLGKNYDNLYTRSSSIDGENVTSYSTYSSSNMYVLINGAYVAYNSSNLAHANQTYYKKVDGTCIIPTSHASILTGDGTYETPFANENVLYSKHACEDVYFKTTDTEADDLYVYINGQYVSYDKAVHGDNDIELFVKKSGYVAKINETYLTANGVHTSTSQINANGQSVMNITLIREKSQSVLRMLAEKQVTIEGINGAVKDATIADIMEVDESSLFYRFKDATLDNLNDEVEQSLKDMSVGELLNYTNITNVNSVVKEALKDVILTDFFESLEYSTTKGIYVNMAKACGFDN